MSNFQQVEPQSIHGKKSFDARLRQAGKKLKYIRVDPGKMSKLGEISITGSKKYFNPDSKHFDPQFCYMPMLRVAGKYDDIMRYLITDGMTQENASMLIASATYNFNALLNPASTIRIRDPDPQRVDNYIVVNMQKCLEEEIQQYRDHGMGGKSGVHVNIKDIILLVARWEGKPVIDGVVQSKSRGSTHNAGIVDKIARAFLENKLLKVHEFKGTVNDDISVGATLFDAPKTSKNSYAYVADNSVPGLSRVVIAVKSDPEERAANAERAKNFILRYFKDAGEDSAPSQALAATPQAIVSHLIGRESGAEPIHPNAQQQMQLPKAILDAMARIKNQSESFYQQQNVRSQKPFMQNSFPSVFSQQQPQQTFPQQQFVPQQQTHQQQFVPQQQTHQQQFVPQQQTHQQQFVPQQQTHQQQFVPQQQTQQQQFVPQQQTQQQQFVPQQQTQQQQFVPPQMVISEPNKPQFVPQPSVGQVNTPKTPVVSSGNVPLSPPKQPFKVESIPDYGVPTVTPSSDNF